MELLSDTLFWISVWFLLAAIVWALIIIISVKIGRVTSISNFAGRMSQRLKKRFPWTAHLEIIERYLLGALLIAMIVIFLLSWLLAMLGL